LLPEAIQGSERFNHHGLIRRAELVFQVDQELAETRKLEFVAHGLIHECTDTAIARSFAQFIHKVLFDGHG